MKLIIRLRPTLSFLRVGEDLSSPSPPPVRLKRPGSYNRTTGIILLLRCVQKLRKAAIHFVMSVCPFVSPSVLRSSWNNSVFTGQNVTRFNISEFFEKSVERSQVSL